MRLSFQILICGVLAIVAVIVSPRTGSANDQLYICSVSDARECTASGACKTVGLEEILVAPLIVYDLKRKVIVSAAMDDHGRQETITGVLRRPSALLVYGHGDDEVWNTIISLENGRMTGSINSGKTAHILFGHCAPHVYPR